MDAIKQRNYQGYNDNERQTLQAVRWVIDRTTSSGMSTSQKVKAIHDYLVLNCDYDYYALNNGTISNESYGYYGVFRNGKAVCNGYA
ncbi:MAG: transglutaminase-like domain-containing protein [Eubacterium sp.]|nr:transglutaminase-like domain-containing protein [Eubacterium sp.]